MFSYGDYEPLTTITDAALRAQVVTQFPADVLITVWACESDWGRKLTGQFNYWGITRDPEKGRANFCITHEEITEAQLATFRSDERATAVKGKDLGGGKFRYTMSRWFASYSNIGESVLAYIEFFTESPHRYKAAWSQYLTDNDSKALLENICDAGYATGDAKDLELKILSQSNIADAIERATKALSLNLT